MTKKDTFECLMKDLQDYSNAVDYAAFISDTRGPELIEKIKELKPTNKMIEEQGYDSLEDLISHINVDLNLW